MILDRPKSCSFVVILVVDRGVVILEWGDAFEAGFMIALVTVRGLDEAIVVLGRLLRGSQGQETSSSGYRNHREWLRQGMEGGGNKCNSSLFTCIENPRFHKHSDMYISKGLKHGSWNVEVIILYEH